MEGEGARAFAAFELYRQLGPGRTVEEAWRQYRSRLGTRRQGAATFASPRPMPYFSRWTKRYEWRARALAWDQVQVAIARDQESDQALKARMAEQEEQLRQRDLWKEEARAARTLGRRLLMRALQGIEAGEIEDLNAREILPHAQRIATLLEAGQRLERLALGEPTDVTRQETGLSTQLEEKLLAVIQRYVPAERWQDIAQELAALEEESRDDPTS
jgi:hypothetical protein